MASAPRRTTRLRSYPLTWRSPQSKWATSANSKKRDDIAKTNSLPPGFIAEYEGEQAPVKVVFVLLDMEQEAQREAANLSAAIVL